MPQIIPRFKRALAQPFQATPATLAKLYLAFWSGQFCLALFAYHYAGTFRAPIGTAAFDVACWMVVGALGLAVGYMLPFDDGPSFKQALALVAGATAIGFVRTLTIHVLAPGFGWVSSGLVYQFLLALPGDLLINISYVGLGSGIASVVRNGHEQARLAAVDRELSDSRIAAMRAHLRPDLVLEAMASMADQIDLDPDAAVERLTALSALMNLQLRRAGLERISVEEEIEFVRAYLQLATADLRAAIHLHVSVSEEARMLSIPPNCVSILVEAVLRARPESVADVSVRIEVAARDARLDVSVRDDLPVGIASRDLGEWKPLLDLSAGLRGQFGPASVPVFRDVEGGVLGRMGIPVGRLVGETRPSGGANA